MCCSLEKGIEAGRATEWYTSDTIVTTQHRGSQPQNGPFDKRLSRCPFTAKSRVRFPYGLHRGMQRSPQ